MSYRHGGDIYANKVTIDFSANINYRGMPPGVSQAALRAVEQSVHYPEPSCRALRRALAEREEKQHAVTGLPPEHFICGNGASELLYVLSEAYRPTHAFLLLPSFHEYQSVLENVGCEVETYALKEEKNFEIGRDFLQAFASFIRSVMTNCLTSDTAAQPRPILFLGNPNNPTGTLVRSEILQSVLALCRENHVLLVLDESFLDFLDEEDLSLTFSGASQIPGNPYLFVLRSFTKIYAMPGLRFGYGICGSPKLLEAMNKLLPPWNVSLVAQEAALAAAQEIPFALESAREISVIRKEFVQEASFPAYRIYPSCTNFILLRGPGDLGRICFKHGFLIRDCGNFPGLDRAGNGLGFFRICIRSRKEMQELLGVLRECSDQSLKQDQAQQGE